MTHPPKFSAAFRDELRDLFTWRRDVRRFAATPLPDGTLERLVAIACHAPSVGLSEPWRFVIVDDPARRAAIAASFTACNADALEAQDASRRTAYARLKLEGLRDAPGHIAVFADRATAQGHELGRLTMPETVEYSAVMAVHTMWLAARAEGIGIGWVSILDPAAVSTILDVPEHWRFVASLCVGFPVEEHDTPTLAREGWEERRPPASVILRR